MSTNVNKNDLANKEVLADLKMISKKEAASILEVSTSTLDRWVRKRLIKYIKLGGNMQQNRVFFYISDVLEFKNKEYRYR